VAESRDPEERARALEAELVECRRALAALAEREQRYRLVVESAEDFIFIVGRDLRVSIVNAACARGLGLEEASIIGKALPDLFPREVADRQAANLRRVLETGEAVHFTGITPFRGTERWLESWLVPSRDETGEVVSVIGTSRDVTARHQALEDLRRREEWLRAMVSNAQVVLAVFDRDLRFVFLAGQAIATLGFDTEALVGRRLEDLRLDTTDMRRRLGRALGGETVSGTVSMGDRTFRLCDSPFRDERGAVTGVVTVATDITHERALETEAARAQKLEALGILAGGIAHDFNNILAAIMGNISLARRHLTGDSKALELLDEAERACPRAHSITRQLLTFAKGGAPQKTVVSIGRLVRESAEFALSGAPCSVTMDLPGDLRSVEVDEGQIAQVIQNLVINAAQAMPEGGVVGVSASNVVIEADHPLPLTPGRYVEVSVSDHGRGIAPEHIEHVFDPFFTTKVRGTGLGLAVTYSVVKRHDGHIVVSSDVDRGSTFRFFLPATDQAPAPCEGSGQDGARPGGCILFMDDERSLRELMTRLLDALGYTVVTACDGAEAVALYAEAFRNGRPFAAAILDLTVPGGMGGKAAGARILEIDPAAKIFASSGYSQDPIMSEYRAHRFCGALSKPYGLSDLAGALASVAPRPRS
jgi:PAS domain S-box-containing protein